MVLDTISMVYSDNVSTYSVQSITTPSSRSTGMQDPSAILPLVRIEPEQFETSDLYSRSHLWPDRDAGAGPQVRSIEKSLLISIHPRGPAAVVAQYCSLQLLAHSERVSKPLAALHRVRVRNSG